MSSLQEIKAKVDQLAGTAPLSNGDMENPTMSKLGQLFVANWQARLVMAGVVFSLDLGTAATPLTGNHDMDADQPEFIVAIDTGWLIPMGLNLAVSSDCDADSDSTEVLVVADRTQAATVAQVGQGTAETCLNLLDGGDAFGGRSSSICTGTVGTVTEADILYAKVAHGVLTTEGHWDASVNIDHEWQIPRFLAGPCQILGYCVGVGDAQTSLIYGNLVFAYLPVSWVTVD